MIVMVLLKNKVRDIQIFAIHVHPPQTSHDIMRMVDLSGHQNITLAQVINIK